MGKKMSVDEITLLNLEDGKAEFCFMEGLKKNVSVVVPLNVANQFIENQINIQFNMEMPEDAAHLSTEDINEKISILQYFLMTLEREKRRRDS